MTLSCIIIDDEPLARKGLEEYLSDVDFASLEGSFDNPLKAMDKIIEAKPDLLFLDIQMPRMNGLDFLRSLPQPPMVVFTTAYPQYAVDGFELDAIDYLLKPYSFDRFSRAMLKALSYKKEHGLLRAPESDHFYIKSDNRLIKLVYTDILFAEALQNYVAIQTISKKHLVYLTFKAMEEYLPANQFIRTHKSFIVSLSKIDAIEGNELRVGSFRLPISRSMKDEVMEKLLNGRLLRR